MGRYDCLFWDIDQTLLDFERSQEDALRFSFEQFYLPVDGQVVRQYAAINDSWWKRLELGETTREKLLTGRFQDLFTQLGMDAVDVPAFAAVYQEALGSVYYYQDHAYELCQSLQGKVRQFVMSNGVSATQRNKLHLSGLERFMEDIFISEEIGADKPSTAFFEACFERIPNFARERALIVGDSLSSDMKGGSQAGIDCCWYNPSGKPNTTAYKIAYEIKNLWEVEEIINGKISESEAEAALPD